MKVRFWPFFWYHDVTALFISCNLLYVLKVMLNTIPRTNRPPSVVSLFLQSIRY